MAHFSDGLFPFAATPPISTDSNVTKSNPFVMKPDLRFNHLPDLNETFYPNTPTDRSNKTPCKKVKKRKKPKINFTSCRRKRSTADQKLAAKRYRDKMRTQKQLQKLQREKTNDKKIKSELRAAVKRANVE